MLKPATMHYDRQIEQEEKNRIVMNLYESGIGEEFIRFATRSRDSDSY
jgi:hypothetical protein